VIVKLRDIGNGRLRLVATGKGTDVAVLDTGKTAVTFALEIHLANSSQTANFVKTRSLRSRKRVLQLARRGN
jgi:hypothetical protein